MVDCSETSLPVGDINVLVVTDVHGWIAGQHARHLPEVNVDIGHLVSFFERLQQQQGTSTTSGDWLLFFNGDFMDGTGLSEIPPQHLTSLLRDIPFSALNIGNHELYQNEVIDYLVQPKGFIDSWNGTFLTSNVDYVYNNANRPLGNRYTIVRGQNSNVLVLGFLYNFQNNANHTRVQRVEDTLQEAWLQHALLQETYDAMVILAHMDAVDPLVDTIRLAIRTVVGPTMPIQFLTGHTHRRHFQTLDPLSTSLEAGRFLDTIGFASFPKQSAVEEFNLHYTNKATSLFQHEFLDANVDVLRQSLGCTCHDFSTPRGRALSLRTTQTQKMLGLDDVLTSCAPSTYYPLFAPLNDTQSLWWLYLRKVIPQTLFPRLENHISSDGFERRPIFLQGTGALRYPLWGPVVVVDDIIAVTPFSNPIYQVGANLRRSQLQRILMGIGDTGPSMDFEFRNILPAFGVAGNMAQTNNNSSKVVRYDLYTVEFHLQQVLREVLKVMEQDGRRLPSSVPRALYDGRGQQRQQPLGTTELWIEFVHSQWQCQEADETAKAGTLSQDDTIITRKPKGYNKLRLAGAMTPNLTQHARQDHGSTWPVLVYLCVLLGLVSTFALRRSQRRNSHPTGSSDQHDLIPPPPCSEMTPLLRGDNTDPAKRVYKSKHQTAS